MPDVSSPTPYVAQVPDAVTDLQHKFLVQPREAERVRILMELGRLGHEEQEGQFPFRESVARTLVELYNLSVWWPEKRAILRAMGECRGSVVVFRYLLRTLDTVEIDDGAEGQETVTAILDAFGRIGLPAAGPVILRRYLDAEVPDEVRLQALEVLGHLGFNECEPAIMEALDAGGDARIVAIYALAELVSGTGVERVGEILDEAWADGELEFDHDRELVRAGVTYLCTLGCKSASAWVERLLYTHEPDLRSLGLWGRSVWKQNSAGDLLDLITSALEEEDDYIRAWLGRNLRTYDAEEAVEAGEAFCDTETGQMRLVQLLGEVGGPVVHNWLWERFLRVPAAPAVRVVALRALRSVSELEGRELLQLAQGADPQVTSAAVRTAANFGDLSLLEPILDLLEHDEAHVRQEAVRGVQHLLLAHRPAHVQLRENKGQIRGHHPEDMPVDDARMELVDTGFRKILRRGDDGTTQGLVAYAVANLRRSELWPRVLRLAEKSQDEFARIAGYHALLDAPHEDQIERLMDAFADEASRVARSACIRTIAPLLSGLRKPDAEREQALLEAISDHVDGASEYELVIYSHALGLLRTADPLEVLDRIAARGGHRSKLEVISALGKQSRLGADEILARIDRVLAGEEADSRVRAVEALAYMHRREASDRLLDRLSGEEDRRVRTHAVRALAALGRSRRGLSVSADKLDVALESVTRLLMREKEAVPLMHRTTVQEDLIDLKLALWQQMSAGGVDDERVERVIVEQLGDGLKTLTRYGSSADEALRALRGAEFFHLQSREMPASADLSPAILSYTKAIELWLHVRLTDLLGGLREIAKEHYETVMATWERYEQLCRGLVTIPVEDANRAVDWTKVPRVAKAMKEKKFTADWRTLSISNSGAIVIFYGVERPEFGATNALELEGDAEAILSVAVNSLALAALRNAMAHEQSASRADLEACRTLAYDIMRGIATWG